MEISSGKIPARNVLTMKGICSRSSITSIRIRFAQDVSNHWMTGNIQAILIWLEYGMGICLIEILSDGISGRMMNLSAIRRGSLNGCRKSIGRRYLRHAVTSSHGMTYYTILQHPLRNFAQLFLGKKSFDEGEENLIFFVNVIYHQMHDGFCSFP